MKKIVSIFFAIMCFSSVLAQKNLSVQSPDGQLKFTLMVSDEKMVYDVLYNKHALIQNSNIGFEFDSGSFTTNIKSGKVEYSKVDQTYELVVGKVNRARSHYKQMVVPLEEKTGAKRRINFIVRAFNDGVAFRYEFPKQDGWNSYVMYDELTEFNIVGDPRALSMFLPSYTSSHEALYYHQQYSEIPEERLIDMPIMLEFPSDVFMAITEAAVVNYAGMYLSKEDGLFRGRLSPYLGQEQIKVKISEFPHHTPWRVISISDRVGALIESNILTNLNEPCKIEDTSWIKPCKTTFTWWNGNVVPDTTFSPGNNFLTNKYYIDFAARNGIDHHGIYGYAETPWYLDDNFNFGWAGTNADVTQPAASLDFPNLCQYAKSKGVGLHVWVHWRPLYDKLEEAFAKYHEWGIKGLMVDFMDRDDQEMIKIQEDILAMAAKYELFIQFHGSSKPSGLHRTYPNEFTREGTLNYEVYKWDTIVDADHDIAMPFTRLLAGATDYHLGGFRARTKEDFKIQFVNPLVTSTRCHMLAMYVVLESYLGSLCDTPKSYEGQPGFEFLKKVPTSWDDIKVPHAEVNKYITIVRKSGSDWYAGTINNSTARELTLDLVFLEDGEYSAEIYTDSPNVDTNPNLLDKNTIIVTNKESIVLPLAAEGGAVIHLRKL